MLRLGKKNNLLIVLISFFLGITFLKNPTNVNISHKFSSSLSTKDEIQFDYVIDALKEGKILLKSTVIIGGVAHAYTRLFDLIKIEDNVFVINEAGIDNNNAKAVEQVSQYDFFHSVQRLEVYTLLPEVLVLHSEGKFILLQKIDETGDE